MGVYCIGYQLEMVKEATRPRFKSRWTSIPYPFWMYWLATGDEYTTEELVLLHHTLKPGHSGLGSSSPLIQIFGGEEEDSISLRGLELQYKPKKRMAVNIKEGR